MFGGIIGLLMGVAFSKTYLALACFVLILIGIGLGSYGSTVEYIISDKTIFTKNIVIDGASYYFSEGDVVYKTRDYNEVLTPNSYQVHEVKYQNLMDQRSAEYHLIKTRKQ